MRKTKQAAKKCERNCNKKHPELRRGEIWLINCPVGWVALSTPDASRICFKTKRLGKVAYTPDKKVVAEFVPIFVQKSELNAIRLNTMT